MLDRNIHLNIIAQGEPGRGFRLCSRVMKPDIGLLILRAGAGVLMMTHGVGKVGRVLDGSFGFADPLGLGAAPSLVLAAFAEFFCALAVVLGFKTRWAAIPVAITMLVAALLHHAEDGWGKQEFPLLYALVFIALALTGGGRYSLDAVLSRRRR